jgi:RNA polymerase sigma-70 factor, ECF subfamily
MGIDYTTATSRAPVDNSDGERRKRFLASVSELRPRLHRYCARMCGSVFDGEDVVQETLAQAFEQLASLEDERRLEAWLFRIAHHKCVDFLRRDTRWRERTESYSDEHDSRSTPDVEEVDAGEVDAALLTLVGTLPPKERASVLLKDVLEFRMTEIAEVVDSTVQGVKAALHRGREKLRASGGAPSVHSLEPREHELLEAYADCFTRHDWTALRQLIRVDARLEVVGAASGTMLDVGKNYFSNYLSLPYEWRQTRARVDGEEMLVHWRRESSTWVPVTGARLWWNEETGQVDRIKDYIHVKYLLRHSSVEPL